MLCSLTTAIAAISCVSSVARTAVAPNSVGASGVSVTSVATDTFIDICATKKRDCIPHAQDFWEGGAAGRAGEHQGEGEAESQPEGES